jgi:5-(aminomethyl)-3-furanmethanol phosphate kinase
LDAVIKVGGSLAEKPNALQVLGTELRRLAERFDFLVVPGGGKFADAIREIDVKFNLPPQVSHKMAILAMDQYGLLLSSVFPESHTCNSLAEARRIADEGALPILLPSKLLFRKDPFAPSWDVTSDSVAAYVGVRLKVSKVVFVTNVDGIFTENPNNHAQARLLTSVSADELLAFGQRTSVDKFLPTLLKKYPIPCYVINGFHKERIVEVLLDKPFIGTRILPRN